MQFTKYKQSDYPLEGTIQSLTEFIICIQCWGKTILTYIIHIKI